MPELETLLRDVRPAPAPTWAAELDGRVANGFRRETAKRRRPSFKTVSLSFTAVAAAAVAAVFVLSNVGSYTSTSSMDLGTAGDVVESEVPAAAGGSAAVPESARGADDAGAPDTASGEASPAAAPLTRGAAPGRDRAVLRNASLTLATPVDDVERTSDRAIQITDTLGGFVASSSTDVQGRRASAELTLSVPSAKLDDALTQLSKLAHVKSRSQQAQDVTDQREQLEAAVRDARADRDGLRARLRKAATDAERSRLRAQLDRASRRVTRAERQVAQLGQAVSYATIALSIEGTRKPAAAAPAGRWTPGDALSDAGRVLEVMAGVLLIVAAVAVPLAILVVLGAYGARGLTKRRRERALEAS